MQNNFVIIAGNVELGVFLYVVKVVVVFMQASKQIAVQQSTIFEITGSAIREWINGKESSAVAAWVLMSLTRKITNHMSGNNQIITVEMILGDRFRWKPIEAA